MRTFETIILRASDETIHRLKPNIQSQLDALAQNDRSLLSSGLYLRADTGLDLIVTFLWATDQRPRPESGIGLRLAENLRAYGLVSHVVWRD